MEVGGGGDEEEPSQVLGAGDLPTKADGTTLALIDRCLRMAERLEVPRLAPPHRQQLNWFTGNYFPAAAHSSELQITCFSQLCV